jgi:hypothetical protein
MRLARATVCLVLAAALAGCAARRARLEGTARPSPAAAPGPVAPPGGSGYASFAGRVRLRGDTPSLTALEEAKAREQAPPPEEWMPPWAAGPAGDPGTTSWYDAGPPPAVFVVPPGYIYPGGALPPELRPPADAPPPSPFSRPYRRAFPGSDTTWFRPGLSTGSGAHGRVANDPLRFREAAAENADGARR